MQILSNFMSSLNFNKALQTDCRKDNIESTKPVWWWLKYKIQEERWGNSLSDCTAGKPEYTVSLF